MSRHRRARAVAARAVGAGLGALILASCGLLDTLRDDDSGEQTATVAVLVPEGGQLAADADGVTAAVTAAIVSATAELDGWTVDVVRVPEADEPRDTQAAVAELVDEDLVAVVGGLTVDGVRTVQPVLERAWVAFVSPADVDPAHTRGAQPTAPLRPYDSYFRTAVSDGPPVAAAVRQMVADRNARTFAVVDLGDPAQARAMATAVTAAGGEVAATVAASADDIAPVLDQLTAAEVAAVAVTGAGDAAGGLVAAIRGAGLDVDIVVDPGTGNEAFLASAGNAADGVLTAEPPGLRPTAGLAADELSALLGRAPGRFGAAAYDAGTVVGTVLARCLPPASSARSARRGCLGEVSQVDFVGMTGRVAFDEFGDRVDGTATALVARGGQWQAAADS